MQQERNSNFELLRSVAMFMIVVWHVIIHGKLLYNTTGTLNFILTILLYFCIIHVNTFMLITGYFQYDKKFKLGKFLKIMFELIFYNVIVNICLVLFGLIEVSKMTLLMDIFPLNCPYWFLANYLILYLLSPFINKLIGALNKKEHKNLILLLSFIYFILPYISFGRLISNNGYNIQQFIVFYFIGSYLNKYNIELFKEKTLFKKRLYLIILILFCVILNVLGYYGLTHIFTNVTNLNIFKEFIDSHYLDYSNIIVVIQTIATFMLFKTFSIKSSFINDLAKTTFGIYLIHENGYIRQYMYKVLLIDRQMMETNYFIFFKLIFYSIIIFFTAALIDKIRMRFIEDRTWYKKIIGFFERSIYKIIE